MSASIVNKIEAIRARNNKQWMNLVRLALKAEPAMAKAILKQIAKNDAEVTRQMRRLGTRARVKK